MLATTQQPHRRTHHKRKSHDKTHAAGNKRRRGRPTATKRSRPRPYRPPHNPGQASNWQLRRRQTNTTRRAHLACNAMNATSDRPATQTAELTEKRTRTTSGCAAAGCSAIHPRSNKPTIRRLIQPCTNQPAAEKTTRQYTDCTQAGQHQSSQACKGRNSNGVTWAGDTMMRHARQRPYPRTQHNAATLLLYNQPTNRRTTLNPRPPPESASSTESGGVSTRHGMRVP